jgi:GntR family transcriptional regulator of vanillate catabolism
MSVEPTVMPQRLRAALGVRQLILDGELAGGERLSEIPLAARLGVSRTPLRLALAELEHEGLLEPAPGGGFAVAWFTLHEARDAIDLRGVLEGTAARLAAERLLDLRELEPLRGCLAGLDELVESDGPAIEDFERYVELNERFHTLLTGLARSRPLEAAIRRVMALPFASPSAFVLPQAALAESHRILYLAQVQHRAILEAIEERQGTRAEALAREHARLARQNLDVVLSDEGAMARLPGGALIRGDVLR